MEQQAFKQLKINIQNEEYTRVKRRKMYFKKKIYTTPTEEKIHSTNS